MADQFDKWLTEARKLQGSMANEATKREAQNEQARVKQSKLEGQKDYEKAQKREALKTAKLREMRLAKEAQERAEAAAIEAVKPAPRRRKVS